MSDATMCLICVVRIRTVMGDQLGGPVYQKSPLRLIGGFLKPAIGTPTVQFPAMCFVIAK
jgi:hypothetical protein